MIDKKKDVQTENKKVSQAELNVIIVKHEAYLAKRAGGVIANLTHCDLSGLSFRGRDMSHADFTSSVLFEADFQDTKLECSIFFASDLRRANFRGANLVRADLRGATLRGAVMIGADLTGVDMREGHFALYDPEKGLSFQHEKEAWKKGVGGVDLRGANLDSVKMSGAIAINSNFEDANLNKAKLMRGDLSGANMGGANLSNADLSSCKLIDVNMRDANMTGTIVNYSDMVNVDLSGALTEKATGTTVDQLPLPLEELVKQHELWIHSHGEKGGRLDLSGFDMRHSPKINGSDLTMVIAQKSMWYGLDLSNVNLQASQFHGSDLRNCDLSRSDIRGSDFSKTKMVGTKFTHVRFEPLLLDGNKMLKTDFSGSILRYVDFSNADLRYVNFEGADLSFCDFTDANLTHANLTDAIMDETKIDRHYLPDKSA